MLQPVFMPLGSLDDHPHVLPPDKALLDWNTRMKITALLLAGGLVFKTNKSCPVIHEHVEEHSVSKSATLHLPILGKGAHRLFLGGTPSMVYFLFHGVSLQLSCVVIPTKACTTENLTTTSTSGLTNSSPYYFHCFDLDIALTSFSGDLLLCG